MSLYRDLYGNGDPLDDSRLYFYFVMAGLMTIAGGFLTVIDIRTTVFGLDQLPTAATGAFEAPAVAIGIWLLSAYLFYLWSIARTPRQRTIRLGLLLFVLLMDAAADTSFRLLGPGAEAISATTVVVGMFQSIIFFTLGSDYLFSLGATQFLTLATKVFGRLFARSDFDEVAAMEALGVGGGGGGTIPGGTIPGGTIPEGRPTPRPPQARRREG